MGKKYIKGKILEERWGWQWLRYRSEAIRVDTHVSTSSSVMKPHCSCWQCVQGITNLQVITAKFKLKY